MARRETIEPIVLSLAHRDGKLPRHQVRPEPTEFQYVPQGDDWLVRLR